MTVRPKWFLITRPEEDAAPLASALAALGAETSLEPMLTIVPLDGPPLDLAGVQALLVTSANGLRAFARRSDERRLAVYAVGDASARTAREMGFETVESAAGDVDALADLAIRRARSGGGALLHVAGTAVAGDLKGRLEAAGLRYRCDVLYEARPSERLSSATVAALESHALDGILFFSPRTARAFVKLVEQAEAETLLRPVTAFCLSPAVAAAAAAAPWGGMEIAERPDQETLLSAVAAWIGGGANPTSEAR